MPNRKEEDIAFAVSHEPARRSRRPGDDDVDDDDNEMVAEQAPAKWREDGADDAAHCHELLNFNEKYKHEHEDEVVAADSARRMQRRRRLLKQRRQEAKMRALLPQPWKLANAGPVGLLGFGMTTVLLNLHNTGHYPLCSAIPAMGICYGGGAQFIAGLFEFCRGNTFGCIAFCSYGAFWTSLVCVWMLPNAATNGPAAVNPSTGYYVGVYLIIWGFFSFLMMCCTLRMNLAIFLVFFTVTLLFFLLGGANMAGNVNGVKAAGYEGIVCGCTALYLAFAEIINEVWDRTILPIFPMTQVIGWFKPKRTRLPTSPMETTPNRKEISSSSVTKPDDEEEQFMDTAALESPHRR